MASAFPGGQDTWTSKTDNIDTVFAADVNNLQNAVAALEIGGVSTQNIAYAASITPNVPAGQYIIVGALTGNITINAPTNPATGRQLTFRFTQDGTGNRTVTWNAVFSVTNWTVNTAANAKTEATFTYDGSNWILASNPVPSITGNYGSKTNVSVGPTSINLQTEGADMSGATTSDAAWTKALGDLPTGGGQIYAPSGTVKFSGLADSPAQSTGYLTIRGAGKYATTFLGSAAVDHVLGLRMPGEVTDCTVDGGSLTVNVLNLTTSGSIAISEMAARRVRCRNVAATGQWLLIAWDTAQIWQMDRFYMDDVTLEGTTNPSFDSFAVSFVKKCFVKNTLFTGLQRTPNFFYILDLDIDGLTVENTLGGNYGLVFDAGVLRMKAARVSCDKSTTVAVKAQEARFSDSTFLTAVVCGIASFPTNAEFHNSTIVGNGASAVDFSGLEIADVNSKVRVFGGRLGGGTSGNSGAVTANTPAASTISSLELHGVTLDVPISNAIVKGISNPITLSNMQVDNCRGYSPGRQFSDCTANNGSAIITSAQEAQFSALDVGRTITGPGVPGATTILSVQSATQATMSANEVGSGTNMTFILGDLTYALAFTFSTPDSTCRIRNNIGYNPVGTEVVAVPASTVAVAAVPYDRTYYVTANAAGATTMTIQNGPAIVIPAAAMGAVRVPAGKTVTPTYANAPTWVVEGE